MTVWTTNVPTEWSAITVTGIIIALLQVKTSQRSFFVPFLLFCLHILIFHMCLRVLQWDSGHLLIVSPEPCWRARGLCSDGLWPRWWTSECGPAGHRSLLPPAAGPPDAAGTPPKSSVQIKWKEMGTKLWVFTGRQLCCASSVVYNQQMLLLLAAQDIGFGNTGRF